MLVKPPPTSAKNPLNLQVQLVVPAARGGRARTGSDAAAKATIPPLPPTPSTAKTTAADASSTPSTPTRQSFENASMPEGVDKVVSGTSEGSSSSDPPLPDECNVVSAQETEAEAKLRRRSSTGSTSASVHSMISSASGKQRIIPLYNLAVHNVVQYTIVTDAGTDSKVAKFLKRHLDIAGVGILEPSEVWLPRISNSAVTGNSPRPSFDTTTSRKARPASMMSNMSLLSPAVTRVEEKKQRSSTDAKGFKADGLLAPQDDGPKKFFGKIFRKRGSADPLGDRRVSRIAASKSSTYLAAEAGGSTSLQVPATPASPQAPPSVHFNGGAETSQVGYPTFGLAPAMLARSSSSTNLDANGAIVGLTMEVPKPAGLESDELTLCRSGRPVGYTWTVRRWAKKNSEGWAAHIVAAAAAGLDMVANAIPGEGPDEVVFEWVKMRVMPSTESAAAALRRHPAAEGADLTKRRRPPVKATPSPSPGGSPNGSRVNLSTKSQGRSRAGSTAVDTPMSTLALEQASERLKARKAAPSPSPRRVSPPTHSSDDVSSGDADISLDDDTMPAVHEPNVTPPSEHDHDDGYDSDPEDSETPWACSVWVKRTGQRQLLATLTPAPHHPKVIAVLKMPAQLRGVCLTDLPTPAPGKTPQNDLAARVHQEVCLTEENLKDVVSVTAMWLVAREEFSGFGRKDKRKA